MGSQHDKEAEQKSGPSL